MVAGLIADLGLAVNAGAMPNVDLVGGVRLVVLQAGLGLAAADDSSPFATGEVSGCADAG